MIGAHRKDAIWQQGQKVEWGNLSQESPWINEKNFPYIDNLIWDFLSLLHEIMDICCLKPLNICLFVMKVLGI